MLLDTRSKAYILVISLAGLVVLGMSAFSLPLQEWRGLLLLAILCGIAQLMPIALLRSSSVSVSAGLTFAGLILYGPMAAIWINMGSAAVAVFRPRLKPLHKAVFNVSNHALAAGLAGAVYTWTGGTPRPAAFAVILPMVAAAVSYFAVQTLLISGVIALTENVSFLRVWDANFRRSALNFVALAVISVTVAASEMSMGAIGIIVFSIPLVMAWYVFKHVQDQVNAKAGAETGVHP